MLGVVDPMAYKPHLGAHGLVSERYRVSMPDLEHRPFGVFSSQVGMRVDEPLGQTAAALRQHEPVRGGGESVGVGVGVGEPSRAGQHGVTPGAVRTASRVSAPAVLT